MMKMLREPPVIGRHWRPLAVAVLLLALAMTAVVWFEYTSTKKPLQDLGSVPWVPDVLTVDAPRYAQSLYGEGGGPMAAPLGVAVSDSGHIYVTEGGGGHSVLVFDGAGQLLGALTPPGLTQYNRQPLYVAIAPDGRVFVSDRPTRAIHIYSPTGEYAGTFEPASVPKEAWQPMGLAFDKRGNLYVTDVTEQKQRVLVFDSAGTLKLEFGTQGFEAGQLWYPNGIAVDGRGRIYVADGNNGRVQVFKSDGSLTFIIQRGYGPGDLAIPRGVAVDDENRLFIVDTASHEVKVYDVSGDEPKFRANFGRFGIGDGEFRFPNGVAVDGRSQVYVTDREGGRVEVWKY